MSDLIGQRFGRLTVTEKTDQRTSNRSIIWKCECDCGNTHYASTNSLTGGKVKSCGCLKKEIDKQRALEQKEKNRKYFPGDIIGVITLLEETELRDGKNVIWQCKCNVCNAIDYYSTRQFIKSDFKHCRHQPYQNGPRNDLTGNVYGKLTVLGLTELRNNKGLVIWKCECECGNICYKDTNGLVSGKTLSCGCLHSKGEEKIQKILSENNIEYKTQYHPKDCVSQYGGFLYFDFYLPQDNYMIEYDGEQHYRSYEHFGGEESFKKRQNNDTTKNEWCKKNNISLIRIPYTHYNNLTLEDLQLETSKFIVI